MKATEQYFPVVLFVTLYKVILAFESVDEIFKCNRSHESFRAVLCCGDVCFSIFSKQKCQLKHLSYAHSGANRK